MRPFDYDYGQRSKDCLTRLPFSFCENEPGANCNLRELQKNPFPVRDLHNPTNQETFELIEVTMLRRWFYPRQQVNQNSTAIDA